MQVQLPVGVNLSMTGYLSLHVSALAKRTGDLVRRVSCTLAQRKLLKREAVIDNGRMREGWTDASVGQDSR